MQMSTRVTGDSANVMRQMLSRLPRQDVERAFRQQLSGTMSWIEVEAIDWKDDAAHDAFEIHLGGKADLDWRSNSDLGVREFKVVASSVQAGGYPRREPGPNRDAPFAVAFPSYVRTVTEVVLPAAGKGYSVRGPNSVEKVGGIELNRISELKGGVARFTVESRALAAEISAPEAEAATRAMRRLAADDSLIRAPRTP